MQARSDRLLIGSAAATQAAATAEPRAASLASAWAWALLALVAVGAVAVFCAFDALPFMDLPAHAGLIALRHRFASSSFDQGLYVFAPHVGAYSLFRLLGELLSRVFGPVGAVRAIAAMSILALPVAIVDARRRLYGRMSPGFGFLGIMLGFGLMTLFGFATFLLGVALLVECTALWLGILANADRGIRDTRRELVLAAVATLLFVTHGFAFVLFLGIAAITALATGRRRARIVRARALIPAVSLAAYAAWVERAASLPDGSAPVPQPRSGLLFQSALEKVSLLATPTLMTRTGVDIVIGMIVWAIAIAGVVATIAYVRRSSLSSSASSRGALGDAPTHARALLVCVLVFACAFVVLPHEIGWFGFVDGRLVLLILVLASIAVPTAAIGRRLSFAYERVVPPLALIIVALALSTSYRFQDEARGFHEVFAHVPAQSRVLNVPIDPNSDVFTGHPFVHYDKLMLAERPLLVSDVWLHQGSAVFPRVGNPVLTLPADYLSSDIHGLDWSTFHLDEWDYVLVRTKPTATPPSTPDAMHLVDHIGGWWLYTTSGSEASH